MTEPKVTVVIVNYNGFEDTVECLESLMKIDYTNYNVIIIDNDSSKDDVKKLKERFYNIRVIDLKRNVGFAIANNVGILIALREQAQYVLLLNNDTVVDRNFLKEMIKVSEIIPNAGILGPTMYFYTDKNRFYYAGGRLNMYLRHAQSGRFHNRYDNGKQKQVKKTDYVSGACMLVKRSVFEKTGLLPKEYFMGYEDIDFCVSARKKGYSCIFVPGSKIWHKSMSSFKRHDLNYNFIFLRYRNMIMLRHKHLSKFRFALFIIVQSCVVFPVHILYYLTIYRNSKPIKNMFIGIAAGIKDRKKKKAFLQS
jgi:GT2 family glycosyltransferase